VFLGDSLTEGVGSQRLSHVTELVTQFRMDGAKHCGVHQLRLRGIDQRGFDRFIDFNVAGHMDIDSHDACGLWLWNLACEGQTIDSDLKLLPLIATLRPELVVIFRGSLESIIRPAMLHDGVWPWWVPASWRGYAALDPRCYFSNTWWRKAKQTTVDSIKQAMRLKLLRVRSGKPLMDLETLESHQASLLRRLRTLDTRILVLGLLPVDDARFPGSPEYFKSVNARLKKVATAEGAEFFDWASLLATKGKHDDLFYRDSFHPNAAGARALAQILRERLSRELTS